MYFLDGALLFLISVLSVFSGHIIYKLCRIKIVSLLYVLYFSIFSIIIPSLYIYFDFKTLTVPESYLLNMPEYLFGSLIYVSVSNIAMLVILSFKNKKGRIIDTLRIKNKFGSHSFLMVSFIFLLISYLAESKINGSLTYFNNSINPFAMVQKVKVGGWMYVVLGGFFSYPFIFLIPRIRSKYLMIKSLILLMCYGILYFIIFDASDRTGFLIFLIILMINYIEKKDINIFSTNGLFSMFFIAVLLIAILLYGNAWREGIASSGPSFSNIGMAFNSAFSNFLQVENSLAVIHHFATRSFIGLKYLILQISGYSMIPSVLLPDKIFTGLEAILTHKIFPQLPIYYSKNSSLTFTIPFTGYAELGYFGLILASTIYSTVLGTILLIIGKTKYIYERVYWLYYSLITIAAYRLSVESVLSSVYIGIFIYFSIAVLLKLRVTSHKKKQ